jgi:hypothetical protein|tara:strand:- start:2259 stop:2783 length:525 start_codon:yes stop_codon:yes gene_type:complete
MPTPSTRTPIRIARGTYSNLNSSVADIQEGEICYATDQDKLYVKEGGSLVGSQADPTFTAQTVHNGGVKVDGPYEQVAEAVAALDIDLDTGNYFTKTINANSTFTFSNPPASGTVGSFTLELTHNSGTVTWPASVKFNSDTAPVLTAGRTHLFFFVTDDGGARYRGAALVDYVN